MNSINIPAYACSFICLICGSAPCNFITIQIIVVYYLLCCWKTSVWIFILYVQILMISLPVHLDNIVYRSCYLFTVRYLFVRRIFSSAPCNCITIIIIAINYCFRIRKTSINIFILHFNSYLIAVSSPFSVQVYYTIISISPVKDFYCFSCIIMCTCSIRLSIPSSLFISISCKLVDT